MIEDPGLEILPPLVPGGAIYPVQCEILPEGSPALVGAQFSALVQKPVVQPSISEISLPDPLQGRSYGIALEVPKTPIVQPVVRAFDANIQTPIAPIPASVDPPVYDPPIK